MKLEGIWQIEMKGPYGWESTSTAFIEKGIYRGASASHYTIGSYKVKGNRVVAKTVMTTRGKGVQRRPLFGRYDSSFRMTYDGEIKGETIRGNATDTAAKYSIPFRATRLADID